MAQRFWIASVVSHEIAHQWFGNLVTCHDWTSLWLNEGFATYFETVAADAYRPQYDYFKYFYSDTVAGALVADAAPSSHALTKPGRVASLSEIDAMFDSLTYDKGGAVLRMVRAYLNRGALTAGAGAGVLPGPRLRLRSRRRRQLRQQPSYSTSSPSSSPSFSSSPSPSLSSSSSSLSSSSLALATVDTDPFLSGLRAYLTDNQLGVGTHEKMWGQVGSASGSPAASWMRAWTLRPGYPLLDVSVEVGAPPAAGSSSAAPPAVTIHIAQQSVHSVACNTTADPLSAWWVPLSFVLSSQPAAVTWRSFDGCSVSIPLPADLAAAWVAGGNASYVLINPGRYGFYQTRYSPPLAAALAAAAATNASLVPGVDLAGLLDDARLMGQLGKLPLGPASATAFLELTAALGRRGGEVDLPSWKAALKGLSQLDRLLRSAAAAPGGGSRGSSDSSGSSSSSSTGAAAAATWSACSAALQMYIRDQLTGPFLAGAKLPPPPGSAGRTRRTGLSFQVSPALDTPEVRMLRPLVLTAAGQAGDAAVLSEAKDLVSSILDAGTAAVVSPDVRGAAYNLAVRSGDADAYAAIKQWYLAPSTPAGPCFACAWRLKEEGAGGVREA